MNFFSLRTSTRLGATCVAAGLLAAAGCSSSSSSSASATASASSASSSASAVSSSPSSASASPSSSGAASGTLAVKQIVLASTLKHSFKPNGKGAMTTESLAQPDDIVALGGNLYVGFQNGVGSLGEASTSGNLDSTLLEITPSGSVVKQWDLKGKIDGLGSDAAGGRVIVSVNEDSNSSMYSVAGGVITHYTYSPALPSMGGSDGITVPNGKILISGSAPGTSGKAPASAPAVYAITLNAGTKTAADAPFFTDKATATGANATGAGKKVALALTDPDSVTVVPSSSPKFAGDFELTAQGDLQMIFTSTSGKNLQVLKISNSVDDTAWATSATGSLYATDSGANTVDAITGTFTPGMAYTAVTPCNANSAPSVCPTAAYPANSLGMINLQTGKIGNVTVIGPLQPKGLVFVP